MATWDDVRRLALAMPLTRESTSGHGGHQSWGVADKHFVWERPLRRTDLEALGADAPTGEILGVRVADLDAKDAVLTEHRGYCFTTPHFDGYPAVLVQLDLISVEDLEELVVDAWLARAPKRAVKAYLESSA